MSGLRIVNQEKYSGKKKKVNETKLNQTKPN